MKYLIACMVILLSMSSCSTSDDGGESIGQEVELTFSLKVEQSVSIVSMRSSSYTDSSIRCIDLLVFDENKSFMQRVKVNDLGGNESSPTFTVRLPASSASRTIHVIANGRNQANADVINFSAISSGMKEDDVASSLQTTSLSNYTSPELPLVMWGKTILSSIVPGTEISTINLIRQVAAIRMECAVATSENGINKFTLKRFSLHQSAALGKVIPDNHGSSDAVPTSVSVFPATLYINYINPDNGSGIWYAATANATSDAYLYERTNVKDNTGVSVIVLGAYNGADGYYKVWLKKDGGVVDPVRNHRYIIRIIRVSGQGYKTLHEALNANYSSNIYANIIEDRNDEITDIIVDGQYELGVSSNNVSFTSSGNMTIGIVLSTNPTAPIVTTGVTWISKPILRSTSNNLYTLTATLSNVGWAWSSSRSADITIKAGNLTRTITVTQTRNW